MADGNLIGAPASSSSTSTATLLGAHLGVTRSRTLLFLSYRDSAAREGRTHSHSWSTQSPLAFEDGEDPLLSHQGKDKRKAGAYFDASGQLHEVGNESHQYNADKPPHQGAAFPPAIRATGVTGTLPPKWVDVSDEVEGILLALRPRIAQLDKLYARHILPGFTDRSQEEREIQHETAAITREFRRCSRLIAALAENTSSLVRLGHASTREIAMANNVQTALATRVQDASGAFRRKQTNYMQRLRGHEDRHPFSASHASKAQNAGTQNDPTIRDSQTAVQEDVELSRQHLATSRSHQLLQSQMLLDEESAPSREEIDIAQRDREIDQIAKSIAELAELFQDLSALVIDQGTMLDRIDFNIEHMGEDMHAAARELNTATKYVEDGHDRLSQPAISSESHAHIYLI